MLGLLDDANKSMTLDFKNESDRIYLLGTSKDDLGSSEYLRVIHDVQHSTAPSFDLEEEVALQQTVSQLIQKEMIASAHDISDGGLFANLMESSIASGLGFDINVDDSVRKDAFLFGESQSRVIVSVNRKSAEAFESFMKDSNTPFSLIGNVSGENVVIGAENYGKIADWKFIYENTLHEHLEN